MREEGSMNLKEAVEAVMCEIGGAISAGDIVETEMRFIDISYDV